MRRPLGGFLEAAFGHGEFEFCGVDLVGEEFFMGGSLLVDSSILITA